MAPYIDTITSETAFKRQVPSRDQLPRLSNLDIQASSSWGKSHLLACHIVCDKDRYHLLPLYSQLKNGRFFHSDEGVSATDKQELDNSLRGPHSGFREQLEHSLVRTSGASLGQVWAAMNDVMVKGRQEAANYTTPERPRRQSSRQSYAPPPLSSPASQDPRSSHPLSSPLSVSSEWAESQPVRDLPAEDYTHQDSDMVLEVRQRERLRLDLPKLDKYIVSIDDGGLRRRICGQDRSSPENNFIALLEAKKRLNMSSDGKRFISDEVVVIHAVQQFVCFLEFHITLKCIAEIMDGKFPSEPLKVTATDWFNLSDPKGRQGVYDNIRGLVASARRG
ncbi:hypothetical protein HG530_014531 [Fusarium avenaceum]|nr:hypothetical protein HG530_014531 [Fusarium avenaceum]